MTRGGPAAMSGISVTITVPSGGSMCCQQYSNTERMICTILKHVLVRILHQYFAPAKVLVYMPFQLAIKSTARLNFVWIYIDIRVFSGEKYLGCEPLFECWTFSILWYIII